MKKVTLQPLPALPGSQSTLLLQNPGRGLRLEVYMELGTGHSIFEYAGRDALQCLRDAAETYQPDFPKLAQVYFYLNHYWDRDLDKQAFARMDAYFDLLGKLGLKALLRFAYVYAEDQFDGQPIISGTEPQPERIVRHLAQLRPFLAARRHQIHALQAGLIGVWGEWDLNARDRMNADAKQVDGVTGETAVMDALLANTPPDMFVQVRYRNIKSSNLRPGNEKNWKRVGFHDDFLITKPHVWNTAGGVPGSFDWLQLCRETETAPMDGEMIWGASNKAFHGGKEIDAFALAKRLREHHFTSLSLAHNYRERGGRYSMLSWQQQFITPQKLDIEGLPYHPAWFTDDAGKPLPRNMYEYIRDHLGYYIVLENAEIEMAAGHATVALDVKNYGFAPPLDVTQAVVALLDKDGRELERETAFAPATLLPGHSLKCCVSLPLSLAESSASVAIAATSGGGSPVRFANSCAYRDGWHILHGPLAQQPAG